MTRWIRGSAAVFLAVLLLCLTACGSTSPAQTESAATPSPEPIQRSESIVLSETVLKLLHLEPAALSRRLELYNVTENTDGSCTVHMTPEEKESILSALQSALYTELEALPESGNWPFLTGAEIREDCTEATLHVKRELYDPIRDRTIAEAVYLPALLYCAFSKDNAEGLEIRFTVLDESKKALDTFVYPKPEPTSSPAPAPETE